MNPLVTAAEVAARIGDLALRIVDVRWYLGEPDRGRAEYAAGHLPGAVFADLETDLAAHPGPGRQPLPDRAVFAATMGRLGIGDEHLVIAVDDRAGAIAARLWWMLRDIGHEAVRVLDGGIPAWVAAGGTLTTGIPHHPAATMTVRPGSTRSMDREAVLAGLGRITLLDARDPARYRGDEEPIDPVAGHIPTARSMPLTGNVGPDGRFLSPEALAARYAAVADHPEVVAYCGSGVTACHDILAMRLAGLPEPMLYPGSWSDWAGSGFPVATGDRPGEPPA